VTYVEAVLDFAGGEVGVREVGRNAGPRVEEYQAVVHLRPGDAWCAALVSFVFLRVAERLGIPCPLNLSGGALHLWEGAPREQRTQTPEPGAIFVIDHGHGLGHVGIVEHVNVGAPGELDTIEGNTDGSGGREGDGVYRRIRKLPIAGLVGYVVPSRSLGAVPEEKA